MDRATEIRAIVNEQLERDIPARGSARAYGDTARSLLDTTQLMLHSLQAALAIRPVSLACFPCLSYAG